MRIIARNSRYKYKHIVVSSVYVIINGSLNVELAMIAELAKKNGLQLLAMLDDMPAYSTQISTRSV